MTTGAPRDNARLVVAELIGTMFLVMAVVGSGIAAQRLSPDSVGLQLLENTLATVAMLVAVILAFGSVSGAHLNPAVTLVNRAAGEIDNRRAALYIGAQIVGAGFGAVLANIMFEIGRAHV